MSVKRGSTVVASSTLKNRASYMSCNYVHSLFHFIFHSTVPFHIPFQRLEIQCEPNKCTHQQHFLVNIMFLLAEKKNSPASIDNSDMGTNRSAYFSPGITTVSEDSPLSFCTVHLYVPTISPADELMVSNVW